MLITVKQPKLVMPTLGARTEVGIFSNCIECDLIVDVAGKRFVFEMVSLLGFYFELRSRFVDASMRGIRSIVIIDFEEEFVLEPTKGGCAILPSIDMLRFPESGENLTCDDIRNVVVSLEEAIREHLLPIRDNIVSLFDVTQSSRLFEILMIIDRSSVLNSDLER